jgi:hypothetical protein
LKRRSDSTCRGAQPRKETRARIIAVLVAEPCTDVHLGRSDDILRERAPIRHRPLTDRRLRDHAQAAEALNSNEPELLF